MSIRDIIAAATSGPWHFESTVERDGDDLVLTAEVWNDDDYDAKSPVCECLLPDATPNTEYDRSYGDTDARFIATFDPTHVALLEALYEAWLEDASECSDWVEDAGNAIIAYRREHGYLDE